MKHMQFICTHLESFEETNENNKGVDSLPSHYSSIRSEPLKHILKNIKKRKCLAFKVWIQTESYPVYWRQSLPPNKNPLFHHSFRVTLRLFATSKNITYTIFIFLYFILWILLYIQFEVKKWIWVDLMNTVTSNS